MKTTYWTVLFLALLLLAVPVLVIATLTLQGKSEKQEELTRMTVRSGLKDAFQIYAEAGSERVAEASKISALRMQQSIRNDRVVYDFVDGAVPLAFLVHELEYLDPKTIVSIRDSWAEIQQNELYFDNTLPAQNPMQNQINLEYVDAVHNCSGDVSATEPFMLSVCDFYVEMLGPNNSGIWDVEHWQQYSERDATITPKQWFWGRLRTLEYLKEAFMKKHYFREKETDYCRALNLLLDLELDQGEFKEKKQMLERIQNELKSGAIQLPEGAWQFFKSEILRLRGHEQSLPLSLTDFKDIEQRRKEVDCMMRKVVNIMSKTGNSYGVIPGTNLEYAGKQDFKDYLNSREIYYQVAVIYDFGFLTSKLREAPFVFRIGGKAVDLTDFVRCPGTQRAMEDVSGILFQLKFGDKEKSIPLIISLDHEALDAALGVISVKGTGRTYVLIAVGIGLLLCFVVVTFIIHRERKVAHLRGQFVSNVSHELKTPVALIRLYADSLLLGRVPEVSQQREYYQVISREAKRLTALVDNVLDFSRIEGNRKQYQFEDADLAVCVDEVLETFRGKLQDDGFSFEFECAERPFSLKADPAALTQIVFNLVDNAVKFSKETKEIRITLQRESRIELHVIDKGIGVPSDAQQEVFNPFVRLEDELRKETSGNGLGLSIVKHAVEAHGGSIRVVDGEEGGADFCVSLPRAGHV